MKALITLAAAALALGLVGCGNDEGAPADPNPPAPKTKFKPQQETAAPGGGGAPPAATSDKPEAGA